MNVKDSRAIHRMVGTVPTRSTGNQEEQSCHTVDFHGSSSMFDSMARGEELHEART